MPKDPASLREERIKELLAWARLRRLDPYAVGAFDKLERKAGLLYLVTSHTARDYAKVVLQVLRSHSALLLHIEGSLDPSEPAGMDAGSNSQSSA
jgi:hypothetical protein